ncbi:MAG: pseudaminic acid synthase [Candidatus Omnitrophica bacterium CG1_02_49_16]|nr:MAG: pseudaminic acid synthase [Candidatus Omnitrophica bacterium CG1_02_49_16]
MKKRPILIVAEMSGNHQGSLEKALRIVDEAAKAGAGALKIQTYTADTMTLNIRSGEFFISDPNSLWKGRSLYELYQEAGTPWDWHEPIFERCKKRGILGFSTPFDASAVDFLESLDVPMYKIASFENTDLPLIKKAARTKKPLVISTGLATKNEIGEAVEAARSAGCHSLTLLKCTSSYPTNASEANLLTIPDLEKKFKCRVGLSDHTRGIGVSVAAVAYGAVMIERHFTTDRSEGGVDSTFSLEPAELKELTIACNEAQKARGRVSYGVTDKEKNSLLFRRSLYVTEDVKKGDKFSEKNIRNIRPGFGLAPKYYEKILGKRAAKDLVKGTAFRWQFVKQGKKT